MNWSLAFLIVASLFVLCAFILFLTVYIKELAREQKIIASYSESLKNGFADMPILYLDKVPAKQTLNPAPIKDKKIIN